MFILTFVHEQKVSHFRSTGSYHNTSYNLNFMGNRFNLKSYFLLEYFWALSCLLTQSNMAKNN